MITIGFFIQDLSGEQAIALMKKELSAGEVSALHSRHKTFLKHATEEEKAQYEKASKLEKNKLALAWNLDKTRGTLFQSVVASASSSQLATKKMDWVSEKEMLDKFGKDELECHLDSGRVVWRPDPITRNVWQYMDTNNVSVEKQIAKGKKLEQGQQWDAGEDDADNFEETFGALLDSINVGINRGFEDMGTGQWNMRGSDGKGGKALGGKGSKTGKGSKGGGGKAGAEPLMLEDMSEEEKLEQALKNVRAMGQMIFKTETDLELATAALKKCKWWTNAIAREIKGMQVKLADDASLMKKYALKPVKLDLMKEKLQAAALNVKEIKESIKGYNKMSYSGSQRGD